MSSATPEVDPCLLAARAYVAERLTEQRHHLNTAVVKTLLQENENAKRTTEANLRELTEVRWPFFSFFSLFFFFFFPPFL